MHDFSEERYLEILAPDLDHLAVDDVLVAREGDEYTVLAFTGRVALLSDWGESDIAGSWFTIQELKSNGYTVKGADVTPETVMTVSELEKKLGIANLKIVKDE